MSEMTRRAALGALISGLPVAAIARTRGFAPQGGVDVSALRRNGDNLDADYLADVLPGYLRQYVGGGRSVRARIDDVSYGVAGSNGLSHNNGAVDTIEGVGWVDGHEIPIQSSVQTVVVFPDVDGYAARQRQDVLARSFAQWLARQAGV